jgi:hypothetical protein
LADPEAGRSLAKEAERLVADATQAAERATAAVEKRI